MKEFLQQTDFFQVNEYYHFHHYQQQGRRMHFLK